MKLAEMFALVAGPAADVEFVAYDGSTAGPADARHDARAAQPAGRCAYLRHRARRARAGARVRHRRARGRRRLYTALYAAGGPRRSGTCAPREQGPARPRASRRSRSGSAAAAAAAGGAACTGGLRHSHGAATPRRSTTTTTSPTASTSWVLGPSMAYTCAVYPTAGRHAGGGAGGEVRPGRAQARPASPGMRLLDVGCGWGGMVLHAAQNYGVTRARRDPVAQQAEWAQEAIDRRGPRRPAPRCAYLRLPRRARDAASTRSARSG